MQKNPDSWREHSPSGLMTTLGPLLSQNQDGNWLYGLQIRECHLNPAGVVHGGTVSTLIDHAFSSVCWYKTGKVPCVTVQLNVSFIKPAHLGDLLMVRSTLTQQTSSLLFITGDVSVDNTVIASGQAVLKALRDRSDKA